MFIRQLFFAFTIAAICSSVPTSVKHVLHEKRDKHSADWVKATRVESDAVLPIRIGLTQNNLEKGHEFLMEV